MPVKYIKASSTGTHRLQNSPYFYVFKYARVVKLTVWNEAEIRVQDLGRGRVSLARFEGVRLFGHSLPISFLILRKNATVLQSMEPMATYFLEAVMQVYYMYTKKK